MPRARKNPRVSDRLPKRHLRFIQLLVDPADTRSIREKAVEAGFSPTYAYELVHRPVIRDAVRRATEEQLEVIIAHKPRVLERLARRAIEHDDATGNRAAELFLRAYESLQPDTSQVVNVTQIAGGTLEDRLGEVWRRRAEVISSQS